MGEGHKPTHIRRAITNSTNFLIDIYTSITMDTCTLDHYTDNSSILLRLLNTSLYTTSNKEAKL